MPTSFQIDTEGLDKLKTQFKNASRSAKRDYRTGLKRVGEVVAEEARHRVEPFSPKIAHSIKVGARGATGVRISAGNKDLPEATLLEGDGNPGKFRHPVFARKDQGRTEWTWVDQDKHPYMWPAYKDKELEVKRALQRYLNDAMRESGLEVTDG